ncbi:hypothetical protein LshimejAT787_0101990 [Lyophyllum shimeji]|uniref:Uncharacterized protein n=1 Tax=Lyophyllum shimeji TaxID=47721 RepID=A0A9P3PCE1_LYOSH|nr:hypothetical protein LshimejAT787_0101990 [Lyophyllum shimeji]
MRSQRHLTNVTIGQINQAEVIAILRITPVKASYGVVTYRQERKESSSSSSIRKFSSQETGTSELPTGDV